MMTLIQSTNHWHILSRTKGKSQIVLDVTRYSYDKTFEKK